MEIKETTRDKGLVKDEYYDRSQYIIKCFYPELV